MSNLKIHINPYTGENVFYKNKSRISSKSRSPFRNLTHSPLFQWIMKLPSFAEQEMNDNYDLIVSAPTFDAELIKSIMKDNSLCNSITIEPFEVSFSTEERLLRISKLLQKYMPERVDDFKTDSISTEVIGESVHIQHDKMHIEIVDGTEENISFTSSGLRWSTINKSGVLSIITERYSDIPSFVAIHKTLSDVRDIMLENEMDELDSLLLTEPIIIPSINPEIEVGKSTPIDIKILPAKASCPDLRISVDNPVFSINGTQVLASGAGKAVISIHREDNPDEVLTLPVLAYQHNFVSSLKLSVAADIMEVGSSQDVSVEICPLNAENADTLAITTDTTGVITITDDRSIIALSTGKANITATCGDISETISVEVLPKLESARLDINDSVKYKVGESLVAKVIKTPENAYPHTISVESSDTSVIIIENHFNDEVRIKARSIGNCEIGLFNENGVVLKKHTAQVISTLYKEEKPSYTAFIALVVFFIPLFLPSGYGTITDIVGVITTIVSLFLALWSIFKEKRHYITSTIVIGLIVMFLYFAIKDIFLS